MPSLTTSGSPTFNGDGSCTINSTGSDRVQAPVALDETQSWFAMRVRLGFASSDGTLRRFFTFADSTNEEIFLAWETTSFNCVRETSGSGAGAGTSQTFANGDDVTLIAQWTSTDAKISYNGGSFNAVGNTAIPTISNTNFDIGQRGYAAQDWMNSTVWWAAAGTGSLSDGNASTIHGFGNSDPSFSSIPGTPVFLWKCVDTSYEAEGGTSIPNLVMAPKLA